MSNPDIASSYLQPPELVDKRGRRSFLKLMAIVTTIFGGKVVLGMNADTQGTLLAHSSRMVEEVLETPPEPDSKQAYEQIFESFADQLQMSQEEWRYLAPQLDKGFRRYFKKSISEALPTILKIVSMTDSRSELVLPILAFWSTHKIGNRAHVLTERATNVAQTILSESLDTADELVSDGHYLRDQLTRRNFLKNPIGFIKEKRVQKAVIRTSTIGFYDKEVFNMASALTQEFSSEDLRQKIVEVGLPAEMAVLFQKTMKIFQVKEAEKKQNNSPYTSFDEEFLQTIHQLEKIIVENDQNMESNLFLTIMMLQHNQNLIERTLQRSGASSDVSSVNMKSLSILWSLIGSDIAYASERDALWNPQIDTFADPDFIIPRAVNQSLRSVSYDEMNALPYDEVIDKLTAFNFATKKAFSRRIAKIT